MFVSIRRNPFKFMEISDLSLSIFLTIPPINLLEGFAMNQLSKLTTKIILVLLSSAYLMGCTGGAASSSFGSSSGSLVDSGPEGSSDGIADPAMFYIGVDSSVNDIAHVHQEGIFGKNCSIDPNSSLSDIRCIIDVPEAELYSHGQHIGIIITKLVRAHVILP
jgi:hypothetical protein